MNLNKITKHWISLVVKFVLAKFSTSHEHKTNCFHKQFVWLEKRKYSQTVSLRRQACLLIKNTNYDFKQFFSSTFYLLSVSTLMRKYVCKSRANRAEGMTKCDKFCNSGVKFACECRQQLITLMNFLLEIPSN